MRLGKEFINVALVVVGGAVGIDEIEQRSVGRFEEEDRHGRRVPRSARPARQFLATLRSSPADRAPQDGGSLGR